MDSPIGNEARRLNPALSRFAWLIGTWRTCGTHPLVPGKTFHGQTRFEWHEGGAFLAIRSEVDEGEVPSGIALIGSDDGEERFQMLYFDKRGVSRHMAVIAGDSFVQWRRDFAAFRQIWTLTRLSQDRIEGKGGMAEDGGAWEDDLSLTYDRIAN